MREFVIGGLSAMTASTCTHPIDLVKVRMLLHGQMQRGAAARLTIVRDIYAGEGVRGFYRGLTAALSRQALYSTTRFGFYDLLKRALGETPRRRLPYHRKVVATMCGGALAAVVACPADCMLVRMQADGRLPPAERRNYRNVFDALARTARTEGVRGWYRGLGPLVTRGLAVTTAQFSTYDQAKEAIMARTALGDTLRTHFAASLCAGLIAAVVSTPLDVVKSRTMNSSVSGEQHGVPGVRYTSGWNCFTQVVRAEGVRGLYKGFVPCYTRMAPQVLIMWLCVENYRALARRLLDGRQ
mmetsp:Transcript_22299/g.54465  ORF Transcript_22299/g.54465 Transcript_22299/m.54465 type:complete len:298 (+) Transcript_22299:132-1025(+)